MSLLGLRDRLASRWHCAPGKAALVALFLFCAVPVTLLSVFLTPPGQVPDEPAHMMRASALMHGVLLGHSETWVDPATGATQRIAGITGDLDECFIEVANVTPVEGRAVVTESDMTSMQTRRSDPTPYYTDLPNTVRYFPAAYAPAAVALAVAKAAHLRPLLSFWSARLGMALAFFILGGLSLYVAAYGEALLLAVLLLPMTLFLAGSINQDGVLIGQTCLACACLTRGTTRARLAALVLFALVLMAKPAYAPLLGLFTLPLLGPGFWRRVRDAAIALAPVVIWVVLITLTVAVPFIEPPYHPGPLYDGDPSVLFYATSEAANLHILLAHPALMFTLPWQAMVDQGPTKLREAIGILGPLQINLAPREYHAWYAAVGVALLGAVFSPRPETVPRSRAMTNFAVAALLILGTWWLMMVMCYVSFTTVGLGYVAGIQGRYALILVPFLLLGLPCLASRFTLPPWAALAPVVAMGVIDIVYVPLTLVWYYYLH
jgi:hypothetical protein